MLLNTEDEEDGDGHNWWPLMNITLIELLVQIVKVSIVFQLEVAVEKYSLYIGALDIQNLYFAHFETNINKYSSEMFNDLLNALKRRRKKWGQRFSCIANHT